MSVSDVSIVNSALAKLGADRIVSLDDDTKTARMAKEQYSKNLEALLRSHPWNFAIVRENLALLSDTPAFGFSIQYQLPTKCVRVLEIDANECPWQIEGRVLVTDAAGVGIVYISKDVTPGMFDPLFAEVLSLQIAVDLCYGITQSNTLRESLKDDLKLRLREARSFDAQEGGIRQVSANQWLQARR